MIKVLSLGAGVQSSTVLLMSCIGELPKLDAAIFADTKWEPKAVYKHLHWLKTEAEGYGIPVIIRSRGNLRKDGIEFRETGGKASGLGGDRRFASIPLYIKNKDGSIGIVNRQCTSEYKIAVVEKCIRRELLGLKKGQVAPADAVDHWFGISYDEQDRRRTSTNHWQTFRYPLIDNLKSPVDDTLWGRGFDREDCYNWLAKKGYPTPPRSACIGCPFHSDEEWLDMKTNRPNEWANAVAFDRDVRAASAALLAKATKFSKEKGALIGSPYLHPQCVPLDEVIFSVKTGWKLELNTMRNECRGVCGV